jgi:hypothetical protein
MSALTQSFTSPARVREEHRVIRDRDVATGTVTREAWRNQNGILDRADGPAYIERDPATGTVIFEVWCKNGKKDRADGPAITERDPATGTVTKELWFKDGQKIAPPPAAANPTPAPGLFSTLKM